MNRESNVFEIWTAVLFRGQAMVSRLVLELARANLAKAEAAAARSADRLVSGAGDEVQRYRLAVDAERARLNLVLWLQVAEEVCRKHAKVRDKEAA